MMSLSDLGAVMAKQEISNSSPPFTPLKDKEYIVVTDTSSEVILSTPNLSEVRVFVGKVRRAGGQVTVFKAMEI